MLRRRGIVRASIAGLIACAALLAGPGFERRRRLALLAVLGRGPGRRSCTQPLADAPQLQNAGVWQAPPILVSGASAYRDGEFLYQDFLYDDNGAQGNPAQNDPRFSRQQLLAAGRHLHLPDRHREVREQRRRPRRAAGQAAGRRDRVPDHAQHAQGRRRASATTIALGGTPGLPVAWPHGANVSVAGRPLPDRARQSTAELISAASGQPVGATPPTASVDTDAPPDHGTVPHAQLGPHRPGRAPRRRHRPVGLRHRRLHRADAEPDRDPARRRRLARQPGGAVQRRLPVRRADARGPEPATPSPTRPGGATTPRRTRSRAGDISQFFANVDFNKLAAATDDDMPGQPGGVPQTGPMNRILASHFETEQGANYAVELRATDHRLQGLVPRPAAAVRDLRPDKPQPAGGYGLTLLLHSLGANYNQFAGLREPVAVRRARARVDRDHR